MVVQEIPVLACIELVVKKKDQKIYHSLVC